MIPAIFPEIRMIKTIGITSSRLNTNPDPEAGGSPSQQRKAKERRNITEDTPFLILLDFFGGLVSPLSSLVIFSIDSLNLDSISPPFLLFSKETKNLSLLYLKDSMK